MVLKNCWIARYGLFLLLGAGWTVSAAPRLALSQTAFTVSTVPGVNGTAQSVDAANSGDGSLSLQTSSSVSWLVPGIGNPHSCQQGSCIPVQIALQTAALAKGTYTGTVTINDPNAVDAPQFVTVTVLVGGSVPDKLEYFLAPGGSASSRFTTGSLVTTTLSNSPWLSIAVDGQGTFKFNVPYKVTATASGGMSTGDSNGSITLAGSSFSPDNKTISVVLHVTTQPILQLSASTVQILGVQGVKKQTAAVGITNAGQGTLSISNVTAAAATGSWLSAQSVNNGAAISITADPTGLAPNTYPGTVTIASNAANSSVIIAVQFTVEPQTAPRAFVGGVVDNETFGSGQALAPGDIADVFGDQLTAGDLQLAAKVPLPDTIGNTQVFVDDQAAPLYFVSPGQVAFQVPFETSPGMAIVRVESNGQRGNQVAVNIAVRAPRIKLFQGGPYAVMTTSDGSAFTGIPNHPVKGADVVIIYSVGLGLTDQAVQTGAGSPGDPAARVEGLQVCFGLGTPFSLPPCVDAQFAGLTPGSVGLYQVNVAIPSGLATGNVPLQFQIGGFQSNVVQLAVQ